MMLDARNIIFRLPLTIQIDTNINISNGKLDLLNNFGEPARCSNLLLLQKATY